MDEESKLDSRHSNIRQTLRIAGPCIAGAGLVMMLIGLGSFFSSFGTFEPPHYFWCAFVGMPLLAVGGALMQAGFMGAIARYIAGEEAPVAKDTFNYLADGTQDGVRTMARAVTEGIVDGKDPTHGATLHCPKCNQTNDADARFCKTCGAPLSPPA